MVVFLFTKKSEKIFESLPEWVQTRMANKLVSLKDHEEIFKILKPLVDYDLATHRLRIGDYRLILSLKENRKYRAEFWVLDVGHRKDIYKS
ncbi:MAG: Uncharacterized protein G01um101418_585 [Parcubacteria group bacterium Gr01-1014_18]|nr:MAG: Uncharacterized protein Greene041636_124 [Parcubacteria group bacterium Greene0416_36]TSC80837.1 MAG: Uncharacterized protein G01um101418_585 [Parcubacteria group bacterium Gr01-1014_18]TSC99498.1 MAG: Uncharacterized protein Greene101420_165 [Parcubacteria group bacterium Greene1014_20]TSD07583.1 MAG: Uncharacterized protein Greene07142_40 [Parcubacteria group bacterium Greene0714_2]